MGRRNHLGLAHQCMTDSNSYVEKVKAGSFLLGLRTFQKIVRSCCVILRIQRDSMMTAMSLPLLTPLPQLRAIATIVIELNKNPIDLVSVGLSDDDNLYDWEVMIMGPDGTLYEGGFFKARLTFPQDFPNMPPTMRFESDIWHPNVYEDGKVCISILHAPGEDALNAQESAEERWRPILGVEQILISVISILGDPNDESPANIDAAVMWRNDRSAFKKKVRQCVRKSQEMC